jgi:hypothetical protein
MRSISILVLILAVWPFGSGTKKYPMQTAQSIPAAIGVVEAKRDKDNGNTRLNVKVEHMATPTSLTPPANVYILWVRSSDGNVEKVGALRIGEDRKAEIEATTVAKEADVFITAEDSESVAAPTGMELLQTHISM